MRRAIYNQIPISHNKQGPRVLLALSRYDYRTHRGIATFAAKHNWHLNCEMAISGNIPHDWNGDGIVSLLSDDNEVVDYVTGAGVPFVDLSILREDVIAPRVTANNDSIGKLAGDYYLAKGYKHFAYFSTSDDKVASARKTGFFNAIRCHALSLNDWTMKNTQGNWADKSNRLIAHLKRSNFPLAIMATRDFDASIVLEACIKHNIQVPEQVAILGVDNNELITNSLQVTLSSVNHNVEKLGYEGAKLLQSILDGKGAPSITQEILPEGVTSRRSTDNLAVSDKHVKKALIHMQHNFANRFYCVDKVSEFVEVSRKSLDAKFKIEFGHTAHAELLNIRIGSAKRALIETDNPLYQVSEQSGFTTAQYFSHYFKRVMGVTPLTFRKQHGKA